VKAVVKDFNELTARIKFDQEKRQQSRIYEALPISIFDPKFIRDKLTTDLQGNLVQSQLLINSLLRMRANVKDKNELIYNSKKIYKNNKSEIETIHEFEQNYTPERAIWWYTRDSFLSRLLNKALRKQNIDLLFLFQFFVVDVRKQLENLQCKSAIKVYRSQLMSNDELNKLRKATGQFISINSFFSATTDCKKAVLLLEKIDGFEQVLFEIDADPQFAGNKPFADIKSHSAAKEEEVLFMLGSIFEVVKIIRENDRIWLIQLKLCSDDNLLLDSMDDNYNKLLSFGQVLVTMGKLEEAEIYYRRLIEQSPQDHPDIVHCYEGLAAVADEKAEYDASLQWYQNALEINKNASNKQAEQHLNIASNYNSIGEIYRKKGDHKKAREYYDLALKTLGENPVGKSLAKKAVCLNNIGIVYQEQKEYENALDYYNRALKIRSERLQSDETSLGISYNNIGNAYYFLHYYEDALYAYRQALQIYKKILPPQHPKIASTYNNIGATYEDEGKLDDAVSYYKEAQHIYRSIYSGTHENVTKIEENIQRIKSKMKK
jgi:tetratricopeptide (TPR) repeat protein